MNRLVRTGFIAAALIFLNILVVGTANAQGVVGEVLKRMENHYKGLSSLKATVKMDQFVSQIGEHDVKEGNLIYIPQKGRDAAFRIDWTKPSSESLSVINGKYVMYRANLGTAYTGSVSSVKKEKGVNGALALLNMSREELKATYDINYVGQENVSSGAATWHLQLVPKTAVGYKSADIWVDGDGMPVQMTQTENNSDNTTILLSSLNKNSKINASEIQISPPKGTKIVKS